MSIPEDPRDPDDDPTRTVPPKPKMPTPSSTTIAPSEDWRGWPRRKVNSIGGLRVLALIISIGLNLLLGGALALLYQESVQHMHIHHPKTQNIENAH